MTFHVLQIRLTDMLKTTQLQAEEIQGLLQLRATTRSLDSSSIRIDLAPYTPVHWLNDLEKVSMCFGLTSNALCNLMVMLGVH